MLYQYVGKTLIDVITGTYTCSYKITLYFPFVISPTAAILPGRLSTTARFCTSLVIILRTIWCYYFFRLYVVSDINYDIYFGLFRLVCGNQGVSLLLTPIVKLNLSSKFARENWIRNISFQISLSLPMFPVPEKWTKNSQK